jgi:hypothetical protein
MLAIFGRKMKRLVLLLKSLLHLVEFSTNFTYK